MSLAQAAGVQRGGPFPQECELVKRLKEVQAPAFLRETPGQDLIVPHREWIEELLRKGEAKEAITAKQIWRLFRRIPGTQTRFYLPP